MNKNPSSIQLALMRHLYLASLTFASVIVGALVYLIFTPRLYEAKTRLSLDDRQISVSSLGRDLTKLPEGGAASPNPLASESELIKSKPVLKRAIDQLTAQGAKDVPPINKLSKQLRVSILPATNVLEISYRGQSPEITAELLNAVAASAIEENLNTIRMGARSIRTFLEAEVPKQRARLEHIEAAENRYRQKNRLVSVEDQTKQLVQNLGVAENQERDLSAQLQEVRTVNASLQQVVKARSIQSALTSVRVGQNQELKELRDKLNDLESKVIEKQSILGPKHPDLLSLTEQRDKVRKLYGTKLSRIAPGSNPDTPTTAGDSLSQDLISRLITSNIEQAAIEKKLAEVRKIRITLQGQVTNLPSLQQPLTTQSRRREEAEETLKLLQSKLQEATIAEEQLVSNLKIIEAAEIPDSPEWPKKYAVLVIAIALGLGLTIGEVLLLDHLDKRLHDPSEAELLLGQPALGTLPSIPLDFSLLKDGDLSLEKRRLIEPYRKLLKALELRHDAQLRRLIVSSAIDNEGKSTVVAYLAMVAAMQSLKTLLVDANHWEPAQHHLFNLSTSPGLEEVVEGKLTLEQSIQPTHIANLSVLTCGNLSHSSLGIESKTMKDLLAEAEDKFDLVILDTPSINKCWDSFELSHYSNGLVLVVCPGVTSRDELIQTWADLNKYGIPFTGFVVNQVNMQSEREYFSRYRWQKLSQFLGSLPLTRTVQRWFTIHTRTI